MRDMICGPYPHASWLHNEKLTVCSRNSQEIVPIIFGLRYIQEGNKLDFLRNKNNFEKPQRGDINTAWGSAPGNPSYDHVE
jgi:hypothetical protein